MHAEHKQNPSVSPLSLRSLFGLATASRSAVLSLVSLFVVSLSSFIFVVLLF